LQGGFKGEAGGHAPPVRGLALTVPPNEIFDIWDQNLVIIWQFYDKNCILDMTERISPVTAPLETLVLHEYERMNE